MKFLDVTRLFGHFQLFLWWYFLLPSICMSLSFLRFCFSPTKNFLSSSLWKLFYKLFYGYCSLAWPENDFFEMSIFNLRIWLIFKETHWRDLHHFHSVLIDFITTSEKKDIRWLFRFRNPKPKTTNHLPGQHTVQANIQYNQTFKRFKLFERLSFYSMIIQEN